MLGRGRCRRLPSCFLLLLAWPGAILAAPLPAGLLPEVDVGDPTRFDWQFVVSGLPAEEQRLPADYDSRRQRYLLYVPKDYDRAKAWPVVLFVSPGDEPLGWPAWRKTCEGRGMFFCAPYGAGGRCPPAQRVRLLLDALDDVRRHYNLDPDQTYAAGFGASTRTACLLAFSLPEHFAGVIPVCGTAPLGPPEGLAEPWQRHPFLLHRARERLSVAVVTGADDPGRKESEGALLPLLRELGVRSQVWVMPRLGRALPPDNVLDRVHDWLAEDLPRRQANAKARPGLAVPAGTVLTPPEQAAQFLDAAEATLRDPDHTWEGVALLQTVVARWPKSEAGEKARKLLDDLKADLRRWRQGEQQHRDDERKLLTALARAQERAGNLARARQDWQRLARQQGPTAEGEKAGREAKRLTDLLAATPYLGAAFAADTTTLTRTVPRSPADTAGLKSGDTIVQADGARVDTLPELRRALQGHKPGDKLALAVERDGKTIQLTVELGSLPAAND
jgi:dienelactone hydrolase